MDLRIIKTKRSIESSLYQLLKTKSFEAITVQDILDTALINRSTFYRYYHDKYDLVEHIVSAYMNIAQIYLKKRFRAATDAELVSIVQEIYDYLFQERKKILCLLKINYSGLNIYQDFSKLLKKYCAMYLTGKYSSISELTVDYQSSLYATVVVSTIVWLLEDEHYLNRDCALNILKELIQRIIQKT